MRLLTGVTIHTSNYPFVAQDTWLNCARDKFNNLSIDMNSAVETFNHKKEDVNGDGFTDIVVYARGLDSDSRVYTTQVVLYATEDGFSQ